MNSLDFSKAVLDVCSTYVRYENMEVEIHRQRSGQATLPSACFVSPPNASSYPLAEFYNINRDHGRSCITYYHDNFYSLKGTGWTSGLRRYLVSPKDPQLVFGLIGLKEATREFEVSTVLRDAQILHGRVVAVGLLSDKEISEVKYKDGSSVYPSVIYTSMQCPLRVKDLAWIQPRMRAFLLAGALGMSDYGVNELFSTFVKRLFNSILTLHSIGGVNDTLHYDNVTIGAEMVDLEWVFVPNISLPDGSSSEGLVERQQKEWIYFLEICQILALFLGISISMKDILSVLPSVIPCMEEWL